MATSGRFARDRRHAADPGRVGTLEGVTARRVLLLLVAAVLMTLVLAPDNTPVRAVSDTETVALEQVSVHAVPPGRAHGRPAADPGLLKVQSLTEMATSTEPVLVALGEQDEDVPLVMRDAVLPVADDRAPPAGQAVI